MNHRPRVLYSTSALKGFLQYKLAEGLSPATVFNYERDLKLWLEHMGDKDIGKITPANLLEFLNYLRTEYVPRRIVVPAFQPEADVLQLGIRRMQPVEA